MVDAARDYAKNSTRWRFFFNAIEDDHRVGSGSPFVVRRGRGRRRFLQAVSTLHLLLRSRYLIHKKGSHWLDTIRFFFLAGCGTLGSNVTVVAV